MSTTDTGPRDDAGVDVEAIERRNIARRGHDEDFWTVVFALRAARQRIAELEREAANLRQSVAWAGE